MSALFSSDYLRQSAQERIRQRILRVLTVLCIAMLAGYFVYQARAWILEPHLLVTSPEDGATLLTSRVVVEGEAGESLELTINGLKAYSDETGRFSQELLLAPGVHTIEIKAQDKFGKEQSITRQIVVKAPTP